MKPHASMTRGNPERLNRIAIDCGMKRTTTTCLLLLLLGACGGTAGDSHGPQASTPTMSNTEANPPTVSPSQVNEPKDATADKKVLVVGRKWLSGPLSDSDIVFIHESLKASGHGYTENGLFTFAEWELSAPVEVTESQFALAIAGPKVNFEMELIIDRNTGVVSEGVVWTDEPMPEF